MLEEPIVVLCTAPDAEVGARLARGLLERRLAACVNILPSVRSLYVWDGEVKDEPEAQLVIKSDRARFEDLEAWLRANHPYDVPELLALPVVAGSEPYLAWLSEQLMEPKT